MTDIQLHRIGQQERIFFLKGPIGPGTNLLARGLSVRLLTVCLLNSRPQSSVVIFLTRRVDTP